MYNIPLSFLISHFSSLISHFCAMFILHRIPLSHSQKHYVYPVGEYKIAAPDSNVTTQGTEMQIGEVAPAEDDFASIYGKIDRRCKYGNHCENKNNR